MKQFTREESAALILKAWRGIFSFDFEEGLRFLKKLQDAKLPLAPYDG